MSYISVWLAQTASMALYAWLGSTSMSLHEGVAGAYFSAVALFVHWLSCKFVFSQPPATGRTE